MANRRFIDFPVATTVGANDIILIWQDGLNKQTTKATILSGLPEDLEDLADVNISGLTNGQILRYDSTTGKWENTDQGNLDLNDLNDVSIVSPSNGQVLVYNSSTSKWENSSAGFVPYTGAVTTVNLGAQTIQAGSFVKQGGTSAQFLKADGSVDSTAYGTGSVTSVGLTMPSAFNVGSSPITTNGTLAVTGAGTTAQYVRGDGSLATFPGLTGFVPYTGATADVNLGTHDLTAERGTFQNNGSSDTLTVNHTSGSGKGINVSKGGNGEALIVTKTSGSGNAMAVVGGRTSLVDLSLSSVSNATGNFLTISGGVVHQRTPSETRSDVGAQAQLNGTGFVKASGTTITYDNSTYQVTSEKAQPNGYASLDSNGKVPLVQINDALIGNVNFQGLWNAATNTPTLANPPASGTKGYYYIVSTAGTFAGIDFEVGDWIISDGTAWGKVDNTDAVSSVFGRTGNVTASNGDYNTSQVTENTNLYYTEARVNANTNVAANTAARHNAVTLGTANGLSLSTQELSLGLASAGVTGALSGTDWSTFNSKVSSQWITSGSNIYYNTGNVGIGQSLPAAKLDIVSTDTNSEGLRIDGAAGGFAFVVRGGSTYTSHVRSGLTVGVNYFVTPPNNGLIVEGNLGIGTILPSSKFQVSNNASGNIATFTSEATAINNYAGITLNSTTQAGDNWYGCEIRSINQAGNPNFQNPRLAFFVQNENTFSQSDRGEKMTILGNGNVGVATDNPSFKLDINGTGRFIGNLTAASIIRSGGTSSQFLKADGSVDSNTYITGNQTITLSGVVTGSGTTAITTAIANGAITNAMLANSSFFVGTTSISLGRASAAQTLTGVSIDGNAETVGTIAANRIVYGGLGSRQGVNLITDWNQSLFSDAAFLSSESATTNAPSTDFSYGVQTSFHRSGPDYRTQFVTSLYGNNVYWLRQLRDSAGWSSWVQILHSGNFNSYAPTLLGVGASGTWSIAINGNAATANTWTTARTLTIGATGKTVDGSSNVAWSLSEIGAYAATNPSAFIALTALSGTAPIQYNNTTGAISITQASGSANGFLSSTDWNTFNNKTSNVGTVTSVAALTLGTSGTDLSSSVANGTTTPVITLNVPTASAANRGALSAADWTTFNNKQNALTNPVTGTGTTNFLPKFTGASTIGNSIITDNGGVVSIISGTLALSNAFNLTGRNAANTLNIALIGRNSSDRVIIDADGYGTNIGGGGSVLLNQTGGNVGIGTTSPNARLDIVSTGTGSEGLRVDGAGGGFAFVVKGGNDYSTHIRAGATIGASYFTTPPVNGLIVQGNVGFGTTSPSTNLQVIKNTSGNVATFTSGATLTNDFSGITLNATTVSGDDWYGSEIRNINTSGSPSFLNPRLGFFTQDYSTFMPSGRTEKMSILGNGNVLIGTTTDNGHKLQIGSTSSDRTSLSFSNTTTTRRYEVGLHGSSGTFPNRFFIFDDFANAYVFTIRATSTSRFHGPLETIELTSESTTKLATISGNVLIGTTTDTSDKLRVNGNTYTNTIRTHTPDLETRSVAWKLGASRGGTVTTNATVRVEIDGVLVDLVARYV
jgi:hypothetical protein